MSYKKATNEAVDYINRSGKFLISLSVWYGEGILLDKIDKLLIYNYNRDIL